MAIGRERRKEEGVKETTWVIGSFKNFMSI